jgi:hypothetical protein
MQRRIASRTVKIAIPTTLLLAMAVPAVVLTAPATRAAPAAPHRGAAPLAAALPTASGLDVFVAYAEDKEINTPDPAAFPVPWAGAPNTTFLGNTVPGQTACGTLTVCYDTGAIRLDNPGTTPVTVTNVIVDMHSSLSGGKLFTNLWGTFTVNPGQSVILAANPPTNNPGFDNFDVSGYPPNQCTGVTVAPTVTITANGVTTQLADSTHVLDTGGIDAGFCKQNESRQWRAIGAAGILDATLSLGPATVTSPLGQPAAETATVLDGSGYGLPNVAVNFSVTSGPDAGTTGTAYTNANGQATYQLQGSGQGEDLVTASVTTVGSFSSGQSRVIWTNGSAANWSSADIGSPAVTGGQSYNQGTDTWTVTGGGTGITGTADQFHYASQPGNGAEADVTSQTATGPGAAAGVMLRASSDPGAPFYDAVVSPGGTVTVQDRATQGGAAATVATAQAAPGAAYLWVTGSGGRYTAYQSADGYVWAPIPGSTVSLSLGASPLAGLAVTSGAAASGNTATFAGAALPAGPPAPAPPVPCPAPWTCADIGSPSPAGTQSFDPNGGAWTIQAGGADITGTSDQFRYVWQTMTGSGSVIANVASQTNTSAGAKAGVMFRASTDPAAPEYSLVVSPAQGIKVQVRKTQGGSTAKLANPAGTTPAWLKISWSGSTYTAYTSADGVTWTLIPGSSINLSLGTSVLAGLAVTSHHSGTLGTVVMNGVTAG